MNSEPVSPDTKSLEEKPRIETVFKDLQELHPDPPFWSKTTRVEILYGVWIVQTFVGVGMITGFSSVVLPQIESPESHIHASINEESWIASVVSLTAPIGCLVCGYLTDKFGRRSMLVMCELPILGGWFITALSESTIQLILGRALIGVGYGLTITPVRLYLSESTLPNLRGVIGAFPNLSVAIGIIIEATAGAVISWHNLCWLGFTYSLSLFVCYFFLPETPHYLIMKGDMEGARKSLKRLRGSDYDITEEMDDLITYKANNNIHRLPFRDMLHALTQPSSCKPFSIILVFVTLKNFCGVTAMTYWTVDILEKSNSTVDPKIGNILMSVMRFCAGILGSFLLYRIGRRQLSMVSVFIRVNLTTGLGTGMFFLLLGTYGTIVKLPSFVPTIFTLFYMIFATIGFHIVPMLLMSEMYPLQVRGVLGGITGTIFSIILFIGIMIFPYEMHFLGFNGCMFLFSALAFLTCIFIYKFLPETKDLTLQEIEEYFNGRKPTLTSRRKTLLQSRMSQRLTGIYSLTKQEESRLDENQEAHASGLRTYSNSIEDNKKQRSPHYRKVNELKTFSVFLSVTLSRS